MPPALHDLLAHAYHLGERILGSPLWRAPVATLIAALVLRLAARRRLSTLAALAVLAGWLALAWPGITLLPANPIARLPGAALLILAYSLAERGREALLLPLLGAALAWWLRGLPTGGAPLAATVPWAIGLWAALALARRVSRADRGSMTLGAAVALCGALYFSGASPHWCQAAAVPAWAGLVLLGAPEAFGGLVPCIVTAAAAAIMASDRGRFIPADLAAAAPYFVWLAGPRLLPRLNRAGPALASALAALAAVALLVGATALLGLR